MRLKHITTIVVALLLLACKDTSCPAYLRTEGSECVAGDRPMDAAVHAEAGAAQEQSPPQTAQPSPEAGVAMTRSSSAETPIAGSSASSAGGKAPEDAGGAMTASADGKAPEDAVTPMTARAGSSASQTPDAGSGSAPAAPVCGNGVREGVELCDGMDCPSVCPRKNSNSCIAPHVEGSPAMCNAMCVDSEISACANDDGCCPMGCTVADDNDCSPSCGDGVLTGRETCEPDSAAFPCPEVSECDDHDPCTEDKVTGSSSQCSAACANPKITRNVGGDQCCLRGANANVDSDCEPMCGNRVIEQGEVCDGNCPSSSSCRRSECTDRKLVGTGCNIKCEEQKITRAANGDGCCPGLLKKEDSDCSLECRTNNDCARGEECVSGGTCEVPPAICGDGMVTGDEECDPKGAGFSTFNCSQDCRKITSYTHCGAGWPPCLNGTVCNLGLCSRMCSSKSDCDTVVGQPGLDIYCPAPRGMICVIGCTSNQDCPSGAVCNGGQICDAS